MKSLLFAVVVVSVCVAITTAHSGQYSSLAAEMYFEQPISHTNYIDNYTWKQRLFLTGETLFFVNIHLIC